MNTSNNFTDYTSHRIVFRIPILIQLLFIILFTFVPGVIILHYTHSEWYFKVGADILDITTYLSCLILVPYPLVLWGAKKNSTDCSPSMKLAFAITLIPIIIGFYYAFGMSHGNYDRSVLLACGLTFTYFIIAYTVLSFNLSQLKKHWYLLIFPILAVIHLINSVSQLPEIPSVAYQYLYSEYLSLAGTSEFIWGILMIITVLAWWCSVSRLGVMETKGDSDV